MEQTCNCEIIQEVPVNYETKQKKSIDLPLTFVNPELFKKMVTDQGPSVADFCNNGYKVVLFFMKNLSCPFCTGTLDDIHAYYETLYKLNYIVIICYQEKPKLYAQYIKERPKFAPIYSLHQKPFQDDFKMEHFSVATHLLTKNVKWFVDCYKLSTYGSYPALEYASQTTFAEQTLLAAIFVIQDNKIVNECRKKDMSDHFDLVRIILDPDQFGIQKDTNSFETKRIQKPKIDKEKVVKIKRSPLSSDSLSCFAPQDADSLNFAKTLELEDVLTNEKYKKYFKLHIVKEFDVENLLFYEEVVNYKSMTKEQKIQRAPEIFDLFFTEGSDYELNFKQQQKEDLQKSLDSGKDDIFDELLLEIKRNSLKPSFYRFLNSDLAIDMQKSTLSRKRSLFVNMESFRK